VIVRRARIRLTLLFIATFAVVLGIFSAVFYGAFAVVLQPDFDVAPELSAPQAAQAAYAAAVERVGLSLLVADVVAVAMVSVIAWLLARRTLEPVRDAHLRQQRFVADASHETRNPLTAIKTMTSVALERDRSAKELRSALTSVDESVDRLIRITGDLLLLARTDDPLTVPIRDAADLSVIVSETIDGLRHTPGASRVHAALEPDLPVEVDASQIERVARNLIENGLRHAGPAATVTVRTSPADGVVVLEVADDGPGIAAVDLSRIFEPFYRPGDQGRSRDGVGLGLAIARDLSHRNGGDLTVASVVGRGTTFRLVLPRRS
jgi:signal transduction histidine kinase